MKRILRKRPSPAIVVAVMALVVALGGTAYARVIVTGKDVKNHSLTGRDIKNDSLGRVPIKEERLKASKLHQVKSAKVAGGVDRQVTLASSGKRVRGRGVTRNSRFGTGQYFVQFDRNVRGCAFYATLADTGAGGAAVSPFGNNVRAVKVIVRDADGKLSDRPFYIMASC